MSSDEKGEVRYCCKGRRRSYAKSATNFETLNLSYINGKNLTSCLECVKKYSGFKGKLGKMQNSKAVAILFPFTGKKNK
jgi:hypothetical protein